MSVTFLFSLALVSALDSRVSETDSDLDLSRDGDDDRRHPSINADTEYLNKKMKEVYGKWNYNKQEAKKMGSEMNSIDSQIEIEKNNLRQEIQEDDRVARDAREKELRERFVLEKGRFNMSTDESDELEEKSFEETDKQIKAGEKEDKDGDPIIEQMEELGVRSEVDAEELNGQQPTEYQLKVAGLVKFGNASAAEIKKIREIEAATDHVMNSSHVSLLEASKEAEKEVKNGEDKDSWMTRSSDDAKFKLMEKQSENKMDRDARSAEDKASEKFDQDKRDKAAVKRRNEAQMRMSAQMNRDLAAMQVNSGMDLSSGAGMDFSGGY